jgi:hypothetical protein
LQEEPKKEKPPDSKDLDAMFRFVISMAISAIANLHYSFKPRRDLKINERCGALDDSRWHVSSYL